MSATWNKHNDQSEIFTEATRPHMDWDDKEYTWTKSLSVQRGATGGRLHSVGHLQQLLRKGPTLKGNNHVVKANTSLLEGNDL